MQFDKSEPQLQADVEAIQKIPIVTTILDVICRTTNMGFAAVARVTEDRWITCTVLDKIQFGLVPGSELEVETTICHEIRSTNEAVIIDHVDKDNLFRLHHTPAKYGFQSYISIPIIRKDGSFFGTLCAIDPKPALLNNPAVIGMFNLFSDLISFHLNALEQLEMSESKLLQEREERIKSIEQKNRELQQMNLELESFAHIASHDLQEPLRKIETFSNFILHNDYDTLTSYSKNYFNRLIRSVKRMQNLIKDLIMYSRVKIDEQVFELVSLDKIVEQVKQDFSEEIAQKGVKIEVGNMEKLFIIPFQFNQVMQNLIANSIKFSTPGVDPVITITSNIVKGDSRVNDKIKPEKNYCHISITDNGIGFDQQYGKKIFEVFQRLHGREEYDGTGIGLSIVKKIIENHNGTITAWGTINKGAHFDIYLPDYK